MSAQPPPQKQAGHTRGEAASFAAFPGLYERGHGGGPTACVSLIQTTLTQAQTYRHPIMLAHVASAPYQSMCTYDHTNVESLSIIIFQEFTAKMMMYPSLRPCCTSNSYRKRCAHLAQTNSLLCSNVATHDAVAMRTKHKPHSPP